MTPSATAGPAPAGFVLCADDYAMSPGVSETICHLIAAGRISATSCMTLTPFWRAQASWLRQAGHHADIGLHLTLTGYPPLGPMPRTAPHGRLPDLATLLRRALSRRLDGAEIAAEIGRQIDAFEAGFGAPPAFIDGHQHVHQLPVIRDALLRVIRDRPGGALYVRSCCDPALAILRRGVAVPKTLFIAALGRAFRRQVRDQGLRSNAAFRGVYDFSDRTPYARLFETFLRDPAPHMLVMCHPGEPDAHAPEDPIAAQRRVEHAYFRSGEHAELLERSGLRVRPFRLTGPPDPAP